MFLCLFTGEGSEKLIRFKRWFWTILEKMSISERQDLVCLEEKISNLFLSYTTSRPVVDILLHGAFQVYFWTSSPALPASEEGFQPMPTVTLRPADDTHLPTANTCISRLYIPLYSSKTILKAKLLQAIKTKCFGFV